jgi:hypothetical protein
MDLVILLYNIGRVIKYANPWIPAWDAIGGGGIW